MHIPTNTQNGSVRHRFFVTVPLFTLSFLISICSPLASVTGTKITEEEFTLTSGHPVYAQEGIGLEGDGTVLRHGPDLMFSDGTVMINAHADVKMHANDLLLSAWNGTFILSMSENELTVAALTSPVVVQSRTDMWIVPAGMQMTVGANPPALEEDMPAWVKSHEFLPLPAHYLAEALPRAEKLKNLTRHFPYKAEADGFLPAFGQKLKFAEAQERSEKAEQFHKVQLLSQAVSRTDKATAEALITDPSVVKGLSDYTELLPRLLSDSERLNMSAYFLPYFLRNDEEKMIALFHSHLRNRAWVLQGDGETNTAMLIALLALPKSVTTNDEVPAMVIEYWGNEWQEQLKNTQMPAPLIDATISPLYEDTLMLQDLGYPERSRLFAQALMTAFQPYEKDIADSSRATLQNLRRMSDGEKIITDAVIVPAEASPEQTPAISEAPELTAEQLSSYETQTRQKLLELGAMQTAQSSVKALSNGHVRIDSIVLGTSAGDRVISFEYDAANNEVVNIEKDGQLLPYSLPFEQYVEWVKEGN